MMKIHRRFLDGCHCVQAYVKMLFITYLVISVFSVSGGIVIRGKTDTYNGIKCPPTHPHFTHASPTSPLAQDPRCRSCKEIFNDAEKVCFSKTINATPLFVGLRVVSCEKDVLGFGWRKSNELIEEDGIHLRHPEKHRGAVFRISTNWGNFLLKICGVWRDGKSVVTTTTTTIITTTKLTTKLTTTVYTTKNINTTHVMNTTNIISVTPTDNTTTTTQIISVATPTTLHIYTSAEPPSKSYTLLAVIPVSIFIFVIAIIIIGCKYKKMKAYNVWNSRRLASKSSSISSNCELDISSYYNPTIELELRQRVGVNASSV